MRENQLGLQDMVKSSLLDRGALFSCMSPRCAALLCLQFAIRHRSLFRSEFRWFEALRLMLEGSREFSQW